MDLVVMRKTRLIKIPKDAPRANANCGSRVRVRRAFEIGPLASTSAVSAIPCSRGLIKSGRVGPGPRIAFAVGCVLSSAYGFLAGAWPFGVVEIIWSGVAIRRFQSRTRAERSSAS